MTKKRDDVDDDDDDSDFDATMIFVSSSRYFFFASFHNKPFREKERHCTQDEMVFVWKFRSASVYISLSKISPNITFGSTFLCGFILNMWCQMTVMTKILFTLCLQIFFVPWHLLPFFRIFFISFVCSFFLSLFWLLSVPNASPVQCLDHISLYLIEYPLNTSKKYIVCVSVFDHLVNELYAVLHDYFVRKFPFFCFQLEWSYLVQCSLQRILW